MSCTVFFASLRRKTPLADLAIDLPIGLKVQVPVFVSSMASSSDIAKEDRETRSHDNSRSPHRENNPLGLLEPVESQTLPSVHSFPSLGPIEQQTHLPPSGSGGQQQQQQAATSSDVAN